MNENALTEKITITLWKVILGSILFAFITGMSWHFGEMRDVHTKQDVHIIEAQKMLGSLRSYRDVLKLDGIQKAREYLEADPLSPYGK